MLPETGKISMADIWRELNPPIDPKDCDYYFETAEELANKLMYGLFTITSDQSIGFSDNVTSLDGITYYDIERSNSNPVPAMIVARNVTDFSHFFANTNIETVPEKFFYNCPNATNFSGCFQNCRSLKEIPEKFFYNCPNAIDFSYCFEDSGLEKIPNKLFYNNSKAKDFTCCFSNSSISYNSFLYIPEILFFNCVNAENFNSCFKNCHSLTTIPQGLFDNCPNINDFSWCFSGCLSVTSVSQDLFDKNSNVTNFSGCFYDCSNITSSLPDVWNKNKFPKVTDGSYYADNCTKSSNYNEIPSNFGGPSTNPAVPLSIKQIEESINKQTVITKSIERIVDDRLPDGPIALGDVDVRELAGINDGQISLNDLHGKSIIKSCINITQIRNGSPADWLEQNLQLKDDFEKINEGTYTKKQNVSEFNIYLSSKVGSWSSFNCNNCYEKNKKLKSFELRDVEHSNNTLTFVIENQKSDTNVSIYLLAPGER